MPARSPAETGWMIPWLALTAATIVWYGWTLTWLWGWFVVPTFKAPALSLPVAAGLSTIARMLGVTTHASSDEKKTQAERFSYAATWGILLPLMCLGIGWLAHRFM